MSLWHDVTLSGALGPAAMAEGEAEELPKKEMIKLISKEGHEFSVEISRTRMYDAIPDVFCSAASSPFAPAFCDPQFAAAQSEQENGT